MTITFETKCWEKDWVYLLKRGYLEKMIDNCDYDFDEKVLFINNVNDIALVKKYAQHKVDKGVIDKYIVVDDYIDKVLNFFELTKCGFKGGYYYSIAELTSIYLCETDLLLHFSSDSCLTKDSRNWVKEAARSLTQDDKYFVANPVWNDKYDEAKTESMAETEDNYIGFGFSDQCFMVRTADFRQSIYNETNQISERYPRYGGELFEKRVDSYMRNHNLLRLTSKYTSYIHTNYSKKSFLKRLFGR